MIGFLLNALYVVSKPLVDFAFGPDIGDQCGGHDDSREDCYRDSVGTWRCGSCAMRLDGS